jgi:hypothetical protein
MGLTYFELNHTAGSLKIEKMWPMDWLLKMVNII